MGYSDDHKKIPSLKPLNMYGYSKQLFDLWILSRGLDKKTAGIKFFNVFGPNEYHKGDMMSVICKNFNQVRSEGKIRLFRSYRQEYPDGGQKRDFIYIKDVVDVLFYFFGHPEAAGIYNLGTGQARTWNDIASAMFKAAGRDTVIEYIDMPEYLKLKYQYFTQAEMSKLKKAGCRHKFMSLEDAILDYSKYLARGECL
jgi:ADP-L-glycero-D-manno-heptose 6-epimerase